MASVAQDDDNLILATCGGRPDAHLYVLDNLPMLIRTVVTALSQPLIVGGPT